MSEADSEGARAPRARRSSPDAWGIEQAYEDAFGRWTEVSSSTRDALVTAMGGDPEAEGPPPDDAVLVVRQGETTELPEAVEVQLEGGGVIPLCGRLPGDLPTGYHQLRSRGVQATRRLIVSPGRCVLPARGVDWGWAFQLYAVWSRRSWGAGDLRDLREVAAWSASVGAGTLLINPLHAVDPVSPRACSPYYPTSRRFIDPLYLAVDEVAADHGVAVDDQSLWPRPEVPAADLIDRDAVMYAKLRVLKHLWETAPGAGNEPGFLALFEQEEGLRTFSVFCTLVETHGRGWRGWPAGLRHPDNAEVVQFAEERMRRVRFHAWLQWLCREQLDRAAEPVALLGDLPIGADPDGFDAWEWQDILTEQVTVGAPPDALGPHGQNWMLPAFIPWKLRAAGYEPFIQLLRSAMRHVGGLRIDHVLGLFRLFWIPPDGDAAQGAYVRMPAEDLLDILALESHRNETFVVGEDLGTVEAGVREELDARDILRYQVWWFEDERLEYWSPKALASVSTHDLPTVAGVWTGEDEAELQAMGQQPDGAWHAELRERISRVTGVDTDAPAADAIVGIHREVARAPDRIVVAQLDDALAVPHRVNVPGTDTQQRPANWSRPLPVGVEELSEHPTVGAVAAAMRAGRQQRALPDLASPESST